MVEDNVSWASHQDAGEVSTINPDHLLCLNCDYRVFGLSSERCPECGWVIDWDAVYIRCHAPDTDLMEHRLFRQPVRSTLRTWYRAAFFPERIWSELSPLNRPAIFPLVVLVVMQLTVFLYGWDWVARAVEPAMNGLLDVWMFGKRKPNWGFSYHLRVNPSFFEYTAVWYGVTFFISLLFFNPHGCPGSRLSHLLRVVAYSATFAALCPAIWCILEAAIDLTCFLRPVRPNHWPPFPSVDREVYWMLAQGIFVIGIVVTWMHLWMGFERYLKLRHGWAIAALVMGSSYVFTDLLVTVTQ